MPSLHLLVLAIALGACSTIPTTFHPDPTVSPALFSHTDWDRVLEAHVQDGVVNYPAVAKDKRFHAYVELLNHVDPQALPTREDRLAFWINTYNALAVKGILDGYSPESLWGKYRYFVSREYEVGGERLNLYDLEHDLLIPAFHEPRIHFAIVCASRSCPALQSWAYRPSELDRQLDHAARAFLNDPTRNRFDRENRVAHLSMIFNWFMRDFMSHSGSLVQYVKPYLNDLALVEDLERTPYRIEFMEYDWGLNGYPPPDE